MSFIQVTSNNSQSSVLSSNPSNQLPHFDNVAMQHYDIGQPSHHVPHQSHSSQEISQHAFQSSVQNVPQHHTGSLHYHNHEWPSGQQHLPPVGQYPPPTNLSGQNPFFASGSKETTPHTCVESLGLKGVATSAELEEVKIRVENLDKAMRWWCSSNWRERWNKARKERNKAHEENRILRAKLETASKEISWLKRGKSKLAEDIKSEVGKLSKSSSSSGHCHKSSEDNLSSELLVNEKTVLARANDKALPTESVFPHGYHVIELDNAETMADDGDEGSGFSLSYDDDGFELMEAKSSKQLEQCKTKPAQALDNAVVMESKQDKANNTIQTERLTRSRANVKAKENTEETHQESLHLEVEGEDVCDSDTSVQSPLLSTPTIIKPKISVLKRSDSKIKKHACTFCKKQVSKMSKHLELKHKKEKEVRKCLLLKKGSNERRLAWLRLLKKGDYEHNFSVLEKGSGTVIPKYRSSTSTPEDYVACCYCKALYQRNVLYAHVSKCKENPGDLKKRGEALREGALLMPVPKQFSDGFYRNIIQKMKQDYILRVIKNDQLLISLGEQLYDRVDGEDCPIGYISGHLRDLGRLLKCLRQRSEMKVTTMTQALNVSNFDTLVACVRELADFKESTNQFGKAALASKLRYALIKCVDVLKTEAIKNDDSDVKQQAQDFEALVQRDWYDLISAPAYQSAYKLRQNKPCLIPVCDDIEKVHRLLNQKCLSNDYATLAKSTLCLISLFNRKRGGEVQRMTMSDFEEGMCSGVSSNQDMVEDLSESEKRLMAYFNRIEIRVTSYRTVPVLLTSQMVQSVKRLIEMRGKMVPPVDSKYLFSTPKGLRPYRGNDVIREFAKEANVNNPAVFTLTHLRKQIATLSQTMEISKWEQVQLAKFLDHDIKVHRNAYKQPSEVLDRTKVAKILLSVNRGMNVSSENFIVDEIEELEVEENETNISDMIEDGCSLGWDEDEYELCTAVQPSKETTPTRKTRVKKKIAGKKKPWSEEEKRAVEQHLHACLVANRVPKKHEVEYAIANSAVLENRTWRNVKDFVYNTLKKRSSQS